MNLFGIVALSSLLVECSSFQATFSSPLTKINIRAQGAKSAVYSSLQEVEEDGSNPIPKSIIDQIEDAKADLVQLCKASSSSKPSLATVQSKVQTLEELAEQGGIGQASSHSGLLSGEWELLYSPEDTTRSSPFFWAFRRAFPDQSDQIFSITDSIPAPLKEVGPATQSIDMNAKTFVSRVKVATLGGAATSMMTTRATIMGVEGLEGLKLKIETTKPEDSTVLQKLGPLGQLINDNSPPFPSGDALERVQPGSSVVLMQTTFCDEGLRISRNNDKYNEVYVWQRKSLGGGGMML